MTTKIPFKTYVQRTYSYAHTVRCEALESSYRSTCSTRYSRPLLTFYSPAQALLFSGHPVEKYCTVSVGPNYLVRRPPVSMKAAIE